MVKVVLCLSLEPRRIDAEVQICPLSLYHPDYLRKLVCILGDMRAVALGCRGTLQ